MATLCDICCDAHTHEACLRCNYRVCRACARRVAETEEQCPSCLLPWDVPALRARLGGLYMATTHRRHRKDRLLRREMRLFASTMPVVERERERRSLRARIADLRSAAGEGEEAAVAQLRVALAQMEGVSPSRSRRGELHLPCAWEGCRGFVSSAGLCGACGRRTCRHCGEGVEDGREHACGSEGIASLRSIRESCRQCPGCNIPTARQEGCAVMWCANCHSFWNWDSLRILPTAGRRAPHNPDHVQWQSQAQVSVPREVGDLPCGGLPHHGELQSVLDRILFSPFAISEEELMACLGIFHAHHALVEAQDRVRPRFAREGGDPFLALRVEYLLGSIRSEDAFAKRVERLDWKLSFHSELSSILEAFVLACTDRLQNFVQFPLRRSVAILLELDALRNILNAALLNAGRDFARKAPRLGEAWTWILPYGRVNP